MRLVHNYMHIIRTGGNGARAVVFSCHGLGAHGLLPLTFDTATHLIKKPAELIELVVTFLGSHDV